MSMHTPYALPAEQREQILTQEINKRTSSGKAKLVATRPFTAYVRTGQPLTRAWPVTFAGHALWIVAVVVIAFFLISFFAVLVVLALGWWIPKMVTRLEVIKVGERGEVTTQTLYWGGAYKLERELVARSI
ncbi:hypothetical protein IUU84_04420 [Kocuria rhizophila]|uniref:hypothetical protein n=1 Tax=Kocuria rhizophila TaxID=72000 RepID=UPI0029497C7B|nr:hypothetical protein [Kocuria rhizophila]MDV5998832.1 hypothetical protein [Kocuria rhizophila]